MQFLKSLGITLVVVGIISLLALHRPAIAAPPDSDQSEGITLEKKASADSVPLGEVITFTLTVKNESDRTINPTLTDTLPNGLALRTETVSATVGLFELSNGGPTEARVDEISWTGSLAPGEELTLFYQAIPPSISTADQTLSNLAVLEFDDTLLEVGASITTLPPEYGIWGNFVNLIAGALVSFDRLLIRMNIPYPFGFAIILFTLTVRLITFPLNVQQIKSSKAMQALQPQLKELQEKHKDDKEKLAQEQMRLYREAGVNPLGGCLPMLVQMPIWIALYRALFRLSYEGVLTNEGFFWIPSLAGPVSSYGEGLSWLYPFVDGVPPLGWSQTIAYLVLPVLLVVSQLYMQQMMSPTGGSSSDDPQQATMMSMMKFMPLMFGYFALIVPSGLTLYWFTSNILAMAQQYFTKTNMEKNNSTDPFQKFSEELAEPSQTKEGKKTKNGKSKRKSRRKR